MLWLRLMKSTKLRQRIKLSTGSLHGSRCSWRREWSSAFDRLLPTPNAGLDQSYAEIRQATGAQTDPETGEVTQPAVTIPRENLAAAVEKAQTKLKGSTESIKQFKDILSKAPDTEEPDFIDTGNQGRIPKGHALYDVFLEMRNAEQGATTPNVPPAGSSATSKATLHGSLGEKLSGGNLLPDVYHFRRCARSKPILAR